MNKKDLKFDIEDLKNNLLVYDRPPKESEGQFNSVWLDKVNNRFYVKDKKVGWKEITERYEGVPTNIIGEYTYLQEVNGDFFLSFNAKWNGTNWVRIDTTKQAYTINMRRSNIPGETVSGWCLWIAQPGNNPIGEYGVSGGWETGIINTGYRTVVFGSNALELDGYGYLPYGRFIHNCKYGDTYGYTGIVFNAFGDFSGVDDVNDYCWFVGIRKHIDSGASSFVILKSDPAAIPDWYEVLNLQIALQARTDTFDPADATTYYFGMPGHDSTADRNRVYIPMAGKITKVYIYWVATGTAGSSEKISVYLRKNNTSDTLLGEWENSDAKKVIAKTGLNISVADGDYFEIKVVCPTWETNPTQVKINATIYIE